MKDIVVSADKTEKVKRVLELYNRLMGGEVIDKDVEASRYHVNTRTIDRDIEDIRAYLDDVSDNDGILNRVVFDREEKGYRIEQIYKLKLQNSEILAIAKILLESRAFPKNQMISMLERLVENSVPESNRKLIQGLIRNESFHYVEPRHGKEFLDNLWEIGQAIESQKYIEIRYQGIQGASVKTRKLKPLAIMFSEMYFYLTAFIDDKEVRENFNVLEDSFPTIYRIDRIRELSILDEHFKIPYQDRFEEGEFRKRIQFMFGGKLRKIRFKYMGYSVEAILDKLPTAKVEKEEPHEDGKRTVYTISAEVFGDGIDMWLRSQGELIEVI